MIDIDCTYPRCVGTITVSEAGYYRCDLCGRAPNNHHLAATARSAAIRRLIAENAAKYDAFLREERRNRGLADLPLDKAVIALSEEVAQLRKEVQAFKRKKAS